MLENFEDTKDELLSSFLMFVETFFPIVTGRDFIVSNPIGRESHFITISRELTSVFTGEVKDLIINVPPGSGKSTMVSLWVTWTLAHYADCNFLYISYAQMLAAKHTEFIKRTMITPEYRHTFDVELRKDSRAKDHFMTTANGSIKAFGSSGAITGQDAGLPGLDRFTGAVIIDDAHKPDEVHSDTVREGVIENYRETIVQRPRSPKVPIIFIGQRLHEADLPAFMMSGKDERVYKEVVLKSIDAAGNALYPDVHPKDMLLEKQLKSPYVFASQFQQDPIPAGGAIYKKHDFILLDDEPKIITSFITADTAETDKNHNDATVFSFWGLYKIADDGIETGQMALHWIDCMQVWVEPKDLKDEFMSFYTSCMRHKVKPQLAAIEKKSTGTTLLSLLSDVRGIEIRDIKRTKASGSKTQRFLEVQPIVASKMITFTTGARHAGMCIEHCAKITANNTHRYDDIADTLYDACKIALLDKTLYQADDDSEDVVKLLSNRFKQKNNLLRRTRYE